VGVKASINGTFETNTDFRQVVFSDHRPVVHFTAPAYTALINQVVACSLTAADPNGAIRRIYWQLDSGAIDSAAPAQPVWQYTFALPGAYSLRAWAIDADGFVSDTDAVSIMVSSNAPVIVAVTAGQALFYKKNATFRIQAESAATGGTIEKYYWDFDGDTTTRWDTVTLADSLVHRFTDSVGVSVTVLVKCEDQFSRQSLAFSQAFPFSTGRPLVDGVTPDTVLINDQVTFTIAAQDNEQVATYAH
jgi:PKD repeat protein